MKRHHVMTTIELETFETSRAKRLQAATNETHERLDKLIMAGDPFANRERYGLFATVQHGFHREIDALYANAVLGKLLPDLQGRRRFGRIEQDLRDLGIEAPLARSAPAFDNAADVDLPTALGWLYVAEGSNLGAAFLLKEAAKLGLSETFGAHHLAAAPESRGMHWKTFTAALDAVSLSDAEEDRAIAGARAAFARMQVLAAEILGA
jgi:heme oxygenase